MILRTCTDEVQPAADFAVFAVLLRQARELYSQLDQDIAAADFNAIRHHAKQLALVAEFGIAAEIAAEGAN